MLFDLDDHQFFKKRGDYIPLYYITIRSLFLLINQFKTLLCPIQDHFLWCSKPMDNKLSCHNHNLQVTTLL